MRGAARVARGCPCDTGSPDARLMDTKDVMDRTVDIYPFDAEARRWLENYHLTSLEALGTGRAPTARDIRQSLTLLSGYVTDIVVRGGRWRAIVTNAMNDWDRTWIEAQGYRGNESAPLHLSCESRDPLSALRVIEALARVCGPLVAIPQGAAPAIVGPGADIAAILDGWRWEWDELARDTRR